MLDFFNVSVTQPDIIPAFCAPVEKPKKRKAKEKNIEKLAENFMNERTERNFSKLMNRCKWGLRSYIFDIVKNNEATDDIISKTMEHIYYRWNTFNGDLAKFSTWMYKIAYNNTIKYINEENMYSTKIDTIPEDIGDYYEQSLFDDTAVDSDGDPYGYYDGFDVEMIFTRNLDCVMYSKEKVMSDIYDASVECIDHLPENYRIVMKERYLDRKKVEDVAINNNLPLTTVKNWLVKARGLINDDIRTNYTDLYETYKEYTS